MIFLNIENVEWASKYEVELKRKKLSLPFVCFNVFGRSVVVNLLSKDDKTVLYFTSGQAAFLLFSSENIFI